VNPIAPFAPSAQSDWAGFRSERNGANPIDPRIGSDRIRIGFGNLFQRIRYIGPLPSKGYLITQVFDLLFLLNYIIDLIL